MKHYQVSIDYRSHGCPSGCWIGPVKAASPQQAVEQAIEALRAKYINLKIDASQVRLSGWNREV